jgi:hypothetical protein
MKSAFTLHGLPEGHLPEAGDFAYFPENGTVCLVVGAPESNSLLTLSDAFRPHSVVAPGLELRLLTGLTMVVPAEGDIFIVWRNTVMRFVRHLITTQVLVMPQVATNKRLREGIVTLLSTPDGLNARGLFEFDDPRDNSDGDHDPALHTELRAAFDRAADGDQPGARWFDGRNDMRNAAERAVAWTAIFSEEPARTGTQVG